MYQVLSGLAGRRPCKPPDSILPPSVAMLIRVGGLCCSLFLPRWASTGNPCVDAVPATGGCKCTQQSLHPADSIAWYGSSMVEAPRGVTT